MNPRRYYMLYDGRACGGGGVDDAAIFECSDTDADAREGARYGYYGASVACYSCEKATDNKLINHRWEWDWHEGEGFSDEA